MSIRIVHSLCGASMANKPEARKLQPWLYALSAIYARKCGAKMVLYADKEGLAILKPIEDLYSEIHAITVPAGISPKFFACIKFLAMKREPLGSVHIDGDVFLKSRKAYNRLQHELETCDVVTQGIEPNIKPYDETAFFDRLGIEFPCEIHHNRPCNTGVVAFNSRELKDIYFQNYFRIARQVTKKKDFEGCRVPDIVPEQAMLSALCYKMGLHMGQMVPGLDWKTIQDNAINIDYCHLWAESKYDMLTELRAKVKKLVSPKTYLAILRHQEQYEGPTYLGTF